MTTFRKTIFIGFLAFFHFVFSFFLFLCLQHRKDKNKKCYFFSKTSFLTSRQFCENTILAQCDTIWQIAFLNIPPKHYKNGESSKKLGPVFNFKLGPVLTLKRPNLGPVFNFTAHIYIYIYACAVESKICPRFGPFGVKNLAKVESKC